MFVVSLSATRWYHVCISGRRSIWWCGVSFFLAFSRVWCAAHLDRVWSTFVGQGSTRSLARTTRGANAGGSYKLIGTLHECGVCWMSSNSSSTSSNGNEQHHHTRRKPVPSGWLPGQLCSVPAGQIGESTSLARWLNTNGKNKKKNPGTLYRLSPSSVTIRWGKISRKVVPVEPIVVSIISAPT